MFADRAAGSAPGPWRVSDGVVRDAAGVPVCRDWRIEKAGLTGRNFAVLSDDGEVYSVRTVGITVSQLVLEGPGGVMSLNRRSGTRGRDLIYLGDSGTPSDRLRSSDRRLVGRSEWGRGRINIEIAGGSADAAEVDPELLVAAALVCDHVDGAGQLMG